MSEQDNQPGINRRTFLKHMFSFASAPVVASVDRVLPHQKEQEKTASIIDHMPQAIVENGANIWTDDLFTNPEEETDVQSATVAHRLRMSLNLVLSIPVPENNETTDTFNDFHNKTGIDVVGLQTITKKLASIAPSEIETSGFDLHRKWETQANPGDPESENTALEQWAEHALEPHLVGVLSENEMKEAAHDLAVVIAAPNTYGQLLTFAQKSDISAEWGKTFPSVDEFRAGYYDREPEDPTRDVVAFFNQKSA